MIVVHTRKQVSAPFIRHAALKKLLLHAYTCIPDTLQIIVK